MVDTVINPYVASAIGGLIGFASAVFAEPIRRWLFSPTLRLEFLPEAPFVVRTPEHAHYQKPGMPVPAVSRHEAIYVRVRLVNSSRAMAKACRPFLIAVELRNDQGDFMPTIYADSIPLAWSCGDEASAHAPLDLARGVNQFIDVISAREIILGMTPGLKQLPQRYEQLFNEAATLRLTIQVACENGRPTQTKLVIYWNGKWNELKTALDKHPLILKPPQ